MPCFRWRLSDLPPHMREQAARQLAAPVQKQAQAVQAPRSTSPIRPCADARRQGHRTSRTEERFRDRFAPSNGWEVIMYEPCSLWVSGGFRYTPDYLVRLPDGHLAFVETKGSFRLQSHSRARLAFADASTRTPGFLFVWAKENRRHDGFSVEFWERGKIVRLPSYAPDDAKNRQLFFVGKARNAAGNKAEIKQPQ